MIKYILEAYEANEIGKAIYEYTHTRDPDSTNITRWNRRRPLDASVWLLGEGLRSLETESHETQPATPKLGPGFNGLMLLAAFERYESLTGILATAHAALEDNLERIIPILEVIPSLGYVSPFDTWKNPRHKIFHGKATGPILRAIIEADDVPFERDVDNEAKLLNERYYARENWDIPNDLYESIDHAARLWFGHFETTIRSSRLKAHRQLLQSEWPPQPAAAHFIATHPNTSRNEALQLIRLLYLAWSDRDRMQDILVMNTPLWAIPE